LTAGKPESQAVNQVMAEHDNEGFATHSRACDEVMTGDLPQKPSANSGAKVSETQKRRKERLAEELRANLKRRKATGRRDKDAEGNRGDAPPDNGEA
jgi:hypothetical protein